MPPEQFEPTRVQDGLHPLYDLSGQDRVVREVGVAASDESAPQKMLEGRPPLHAILPAEHDDDPTVFERVLVLEAGSKILGPGHHGLPTKTRGRSTLIASTESPNDGSTVEPGTTYPVALAVLNDLWTIVGGRLCMGLIGRDDPWHVSYEVQAGRAHQRPMVDVLIWARGQKEPGKGFVGTPSVPLGPQQVLTPDPLGGGNQTTTPDPGPGPAADKSTTSPDPGPPGPTGPPTVYTDPSDPTSASF